VLGVGVMLIFLFLCCFLLFLCSLFGLFGLSVNFLLKFLQLPNLKIPRKIVLSVLLTIPLSFILMIGSGFAADSLGYFPESDEAMEDELTEQAEEVVAKKKTEEQEEHRNTEKKDNEADGDEKKADKSKKEQSQTTDSKKREASDQDKQKKQVKQEKTRGLDELKVHFIDVGQADAALIQFGKRTLLIDTGDWRGSEVVPYLEKMGVTSIDVVVGSHPHADHIGQLDKVIERFDVGEVWMSGGTANSQVFNRVISAIDAHNIGYDEPRAGDRFEIDDLRIDILSPNNLTGDLNNDSIVMKLTYGSVSFLFSGDAEREAERKMVSSGQDLRATVLKVGHHGSSTSTTSSFLDKVQPKIAIISVGQNNSYGHPSNEVINRLKNAGVELYVTMTHGTIVVTTKGDEVNVTTGRNGTVKATKIPSTSKKQKSNSSKQSSTPKKESHTTSASSNCVNINEASETELQKIKHIGPARASKVVEARPYDSVDDLTRVSGIAEKRLANIKAEGIACVK